MKKRKLRKYDHWKRRGNSLVWATIERGVRKRKARKNKERLA